jgi:hypothetical protein
MKTRYLFMTVMVIVATFDSAGFALNSRQRKAPAQPALVQPQAEKRATNSRMLTHWIHLSGRVYHMQQRQH